MITLSDIAKISTAITPTAGAAGTDDIEGTTLDMAGFDSVLMLIRFGSITTGAVTSIKAQQGDESDLSDAEDILGSSQTIGAGDDDETFYIDLKSVQKRYVRIYVDRATQNAVVAAANYLQYNARRVPVTHGTGVTGEQVVPTIAGTA